MNLDYNHEQRHYTGAPLLVICVMLHIICAKASGFNYDFSDIIRRFGVSEVVSIASGVSSVVLAVVMGNHYILRNRLLKKELKEKKEDVTEEKEQDKDSL